MKKYKFKTVTVDGEKRVELWIDNKFIDEAEVFSQFSVREAKESLTNQYLRN